MSELLLTGDIHDLFEVDELEVILSTVHSQGVADGSQDNRQALYAYFIAVSNDNMSLLRNSYI